MNPGAESQSRLTRIRSPKAGLVSDSAHEAD